MTGSTGWSQWTKDVGEGLNLYAAMAQDVQGIETNVQDAIAGWQDLATLADNSEYKDLFSAGSPASQMVAKVQGDAETYMKSVSLEIDANQPGSYIPLEEGGGGGGGPQATLWDFASGATTTFSNDMHDVVVSDLGQLNTDWEQSSTLQGATYEVQAGESSWYYEATGSAAQWAPYVHTTGGDPTALNNDLQA
ncbi:MAG TPA: hypothetical protein VLE89_03060 [Chlamydiales bacterium]|nr:hypothetical protein [Chlamydiales bacterium]